MRPAEACAACLAAILRLISSMSPARSVSCALAVVPIVR